MGLPVHQGGTYLCIEGPAFSTCAESHVYRQWGCHIIGMTSATEARLAREAEICYASISLVTDYDVWHAEEETVSVELILENLQHNITNAKALLARALQVIPSEPQPGSCPCPTALENTIVTDPGLIPAEVKKNLAPIIGRHLAE
jgi:5'-methylthioadenosine phosphorylase